ncbi:hypothetical protein [Chryseobacterium sp.]|uniref:hypothetical protein n=1 Tax=Chryseobacterium sp. TaxID=1871047 RepID=UPI002896E558|nr:hypothetical protein [Chryseobacterium sp.]
MKNIIFIISLLIFQSCNAQQRNKITDSTAFYNASQYKDWEFDPKYCWPNSNCSREDNDLFLIKGNDKIRITIDEERIRVEKSNIVRPYIFVSIYNVNTKKRSASYNYFLSSANEPIGISENYDETGKIVKEKNWDKPYKFSIKDMVKKFKEEYNTDLLNRKNVHRFYRYENSKTLGIPIYKIYLNTDIGNKWMEYLIDGDSGKTLYTMKISEGDTTDILEEYLKSIGKFKSSSTKYDPSTD